MLTNAQSWRRLKSSRSKQRLKHETEYLNDCKSKVDVPLRREESKVIIPNPTSSTADHTASTASSPAGRRVKFSSVIRVCLVPCRSDFQSDFHALFWMREDYQTFKEDAVRELRAHWLTNRTTVKEAIIDLYQPSAADYAASKTFLSHVDSVAQLRHLCLEQASTEDLVKLATPTLDLSCSNAESLLSGANNNNNDRKEHRTLSVAVCSTSSESSEGSSEVEAWSPTSTDTTGSNNSEAAQMGDAPSTTPLCLTSPSSAGTLLGQVTAPHVDPITPLRTDSLKDSSKSAQERSQESTQEPTQESKQDSILPLATPTKPLITLNSALISAVTTSSATSSGSSTPAPASRSHSPLPSTQPPSPSSASVLISAPTRRDRESEKESKPGGEGLRIVLMEEANSPASSISSFETPIMIYGQS